MTVTKHGNQYRDRAFVCVDCGCEFYANSSEVEYKWVESFMLGKRIFVASCNCPECGDECTVRVDEKEG